MLILQLRIVTAVLAPNDQWLVGAWGAGPAECASDSGIHFEIDGTYNDPEGEGFWELAGRRLLVSGVSGDDFGRLEVVRITVRISARMEMEWADGTRVEFHRCAEAGR